MTSALPAARPGDVSVLMRALVRHVAFVGSLLLLLAFAGALFAR